MERAHILSALDRTDGRVYGKQGAAALLGIQPTTLQSRIKKYEADGLVETSRK